MATTYLLHTDFCRHCLHREPWALEALRAVERDSIRVSTVTVADLYTTAAAVEASKEDRKQRVDQVRAFLAPIQLLAFGQGEAVAFAKVMAYFLQDGPEPGISEKDLMIAMTAWENHCVLVTGSPGPFKGIEDLKTVDWGRGKSPKHSTVKRARA